MTREQADRDLFDRIASRYARKDVVASSALARRHQLLAAIEPVLEQLPNLGTIVDVGCGVGATAMYLAGHYEHYIGIDQSEEMIKAAIVFNRGNPKAEFIAENVKSRDAQVQIRGKAMSQGIAKPSSQKRYSDACGGTTRHILSVGKAVSSLRPSVFGHSNELCAWLPPILRGK